MKTPERELADWAESILCNALPMSHCSMKEWNSILHNWRNAKHRLFPDGLLTPKEEPVPSDDYARECARAHSEIRKLKHDIDAYRGALGYSVPADHDGKLSNGVTPQCGLCQSHINAANESIGLHNELIFAVARKFPCETRHETALRYIRQAESVATSGPVSKNPDTAYSDFRGATTFGRGKIP